MKPYKNYPKSNNELIRIFEDNVLSEELTWHRDLEDREVTIIKSEGWKYQADNQLPIELKPSDQIMIPKMMWHRIMRGNGPLVIKIKFL